MRFHTTIEFAAARSNHREAYAAYDQLATAGTERDSITGQWAPECDAEAKAMDAFLSMPACTPTEVAEKIRYMQERQIDAGWTDDYPRYMAQIERDLVELQRPCVSPTFVRAFDIWREAHRAHSEDTSGDDTVDGKLCDFSAAANRALLALPCVTPGDLILKLYVEMLTSSGSTLRESSGSAFEIDRRVLDGPYLEDAASVAFERDIRDCDLGRCLTALGRVQFDAEAWFVAAQRANATVVVVIQRDGTRGLWTAPSGGELDEYRDQFRLCRELLAGGLGVVSHERSKAVADYIAENHPELIADSRQIEEISA